MRLMRPACWCASQCLCSLWTYHWTVSSPTSPSAAAPHLTHSTMSNLGAHLLFTSRRLPLPLLCLPWPPPDRPLMKMSQTLWSSVLLMPLPPLPSPAYSLNQPPLTYPSLCHSCLPWLNLSAFCCFCPLQHRLLIPQCDPLLALLLVIGHGIMAGNIAY
jgi:hypothetical protein